jgi:hypothetical protein
MKIILIEDSSSFLFCDCGEEIHIYSRQKSCEKCGKKYTLIQDIKVEEPTGHCNNLICYNRTYNNEKFCSDSCKEQSEVSDIIEGYNK